MICRDCGGTGSYGGFGLMPCIWCDGKGVRNMPNDSQAWLIERRPFSDTHMYLCAETSTDEYKREGGFDWTKDVSRALRFCRRGDANSFIGAMLRFGNTLPHKDAIGGLRHGDETPEACEHIWS